jgi:hypothetical protein
MNHKIKTLLLDLKTKRAEQERELTRRSLSEVVEISRIRSLHDQTQSSRDTKTAKTQKKKNSEYDRISKRVLLLLVRTKEKVSKD